MYCFDIKNKSIFPEKQYIGIKGSCININESEQKPAATKTSHHTGIIRHGGRHRTSDTKAKPKNQPLLTIRSLADSPGLLLPQTQAPLTCLSFSISRIPCISVSKYLRGSLLWLFFIPIVCQRNDQVITPAQGCLLPGGPGSQRGQLRASETQQDSTATQGYFVVCFWLLFLHTDYQAGN